MLRPKKLKKRGSARLLWKRTKFRYLKSRQIIRRSRWATSLKIAGKFRISIVSSWIIWTLQRREKLNTSRANLNIWTIKLALKMSLNAVTSIRMRQPNRSTRRVKSVTGIRWGKMSIRIVVQNNTKYDLKNKIVPHNQASMIL